MTNIIIYLTITDAYKIITVQIICYFVGYKCLKLHIRKPNLLINKEWTVSNQNKKTLMLIKTIS